MKIDPKKAKRAVGPKPNPETLEKSADALKAVGTPDEVVAPILMQDMDTRALAAAHHAMYLYYDTDRQLKKVMELLKCDKPRAGKILRIVRQHLVLDAAIPNRDALRNDVYNKLKLVSDACVDDLNHEDPKTRYLARQHLMNLHRQIATLYGLNIPTKQQIEFSSTNPEHYADVVEAEISEAKKILLSEDNLAGAREKTKARIMAGPNPATIWRHKKRDEQAKKKREKEEDES